MLSQIMKYPKEDLLCNVCISANDALELSYCAVSGRILGVVFQHYVHNLRIARLEDYLRVLTVCRVWELTYHSSSMS